MKKEILIEEIKAELNICPEDPYEDDYCRGVRVGEQNGLDCAIKVIDRLFGESKELGR